MKLVAHKNTCTVYVKNGDMKKVHSMPQEQQDHFYRFMQNLHEKYSVVMVEVVEDGKADSIVS